VARPKSTSPAPAVSGGQASYVIERLVKERRVSTGEINRYLAEMNKEISDLESRLQHLRETQGDLLPRGQTGIRPKPARGRRPGPPGQLAERQRPFGSSSAVPPTEAFIPPRPTPPKPRAKDAGTKGAKRAKRMTAEVLASRQLQGRYIALVRRFPVSKRKQYSRMAREKGRDAAIKEMTAARKK
jgi:hypothetical protein